MDDGAGMDRTGKSRPGSGAAGPAHGEAMPDGLRRVEAALEHASDADAQPGASAAEAIDRATAAVGHDDGKR